MKCRIFGAVLFAALAVAPVGAQTPDGTDINKAIPIYFGQTITDTLDSRTKGLQVYSINLSRGQTVTGLIKSTNLRGSFVLASPSMTSVVNTGCNQYVAIGACDTDLTARSFRYAVAATGKYYVAVHVFGGSSAIEMQITAEGTPIAVPNPTSAGCLSGRVDSITYSLQLIAAGLPDEVVIGGARACAACQVKAPLYPEIVNRIENAMRSRLNVEACYDSAGSIFQIKMSQP